MKKRWSRREFLVISTVTGMGLALGGCNALSGEGRVIRIGYISPVSGPLADFAQGDGYVVKRIRDFLAEGIQIGNKTHPVEIIMADSESNPELAGELAIQLINEQNVDIMLAMSTPETTNPVADVCEVNQIPCITSLTPWQPWYFRTQVPPTGYKWTYHFMWGLEDVIQVYLSIWESLATNKVVGAMWPNDSDGIAWSDPDLGFPNAMIGRGFRLIDAGRYENLTADFGPQIDMFMEAGVEILTGVMLPPDLANFLVQADERGFRPKVVTVGKAALFPSSIAAIPNGLGEGLTSEIWWHPNHPFTSSLTGFTARELSSVYEADTGQQSIQALGFAHAMFEVVVDVLQRTADIEDKETIVKSIQETSLDTIIGTISWQNGPTPNVSKTPVVGGQWRAGSVFPWELVVTNNSEAPMIDVTGEVVVMPKATS
ncbi:MAG TPA: ABC transporter substrate-binding protein [Anaerolineae bacterium]|nr:ABC transporter substrate-binding protein [Anaerolineae bacterium]